MRKTLWFVLLLLVLTCLVVFSACEKNNIPDNDNNSNFNENDGEGDQTQIASIAFDVTQFNDISSEKLISILGVPDNITQTNERGFASFPCELYDYEDHELGFLRFDVINNKVTAISINGELPYNNGKVLENLNVKVTNDDYISEDSSYKKWECPTNDIDLIHITLIDTNKDTYKSLTVEFDSQYYREWNLPVFYGEVSPGEYNVLTKDFIKSLLTYPDSANFPAFDWDYARNDYYFRVESYVDAQNVFGGTVRHSFSLVYHNDTRILAYAILDDEVVIDNEYLPTKDIIESMFEDTEGGTQQPLPPPTEPNPPLVEYKIYTETELPISVKYGTKEIWVNGIDYIYCDIDKTNCTFCISFDLISNYTVEGFDFKFSLTGKNTGTVKEYLLEDINVYGEDGNYISLDGDFIGSLPVDDYRIMFYEVREENKESSEGLQFVLNSGGKSYELVDIGTCTDSVIIVDTYQGLPVTRIGLSAFTACRIDTLVLGKNVGYVDMCGINCCIIDRLVIQGDRINFNTGALADTHLGEIIFAGNVKEIDLRSVGYSIDGADILFFGTSVEEIQLSTDFYIKQICYSGTEVQFRQIIKTGVPPTISIKYNTTPFE